MMDQSIAEAVFAVWLSLGAGIAVVLSRTVNARLASETSPLVGSLINHLVGLPICIFFVLLLQTPLNIVAIDIKPWMYFGGVLGVMTVLLFNIIVPKVPAFRLTLLAFIGQIFTGIALDLAFGLEYSTSTFFGGLVIAVGLLINMIIEQRKRKK